MTIKARTDGASARRHGALGLLLACSASAISVATSVATPAAAQTASRTSGSYQPQTNALSSVSGAAATNATPQYGVPAQSLGASNGTAAQSQSPAAAAVTTGSIPRTGTAGVEPLYAEDLNQSSDLSLDTGAEQIDAQEAPRIPGDPTGIRLGTFLLRPSINQSINTETTRSNGVKTQRNYTATAIRGTLSSDWSRHALTVTGEGTFEHNLSGGQTGTRPGATINADLRLDLSDQTVAHITGGYRFSRDNVYDPNALNGASTQPGQNLWTGGASIQRNFGKIRGTAAVDLSRYSYTDAQFANGVTVKMTDRNRTGIDGRLRLGYELSTALVPFVEIASGRTTYDQRLDTFGYARSSSRYAGRAGVEIDLGEKLRGEIATGYEIVDYQDARLKSVGAVTFDGNAVWSPQRGTDVNLGLKTSVQDSTTPGQNGWIEYQLTGGLTHQMRDNVVARLTGGSTLRQFNTQGFGDQTVWVAGAGVTWAINRYLDLTGDVAYERASGGGLNDSVVRAGVGLTLKR